MRELQDLQIGSRLIVPRHTPQPWRLHMRPAGGFTIEADTGHVLCSRNDWYPTMVSEGRANARLFYAAPKMFALLGVTYHALQSYAHGNSAPALAAGIAELVGNALIETTEGPHA